jgi:hypothetical protein
MTSRYISIFSIGFIRLQARQRGYTAKKKVDAARHILLRKISAIRVQCFIRQFLSRCRLKQKVIHLALIIKSAAIITTFFRIIKAKKMVRELKELKWNNYLTYSATKIQVQWRGFEAKGE